MQIEELFGVLRSFQESRLLLTAIELNLFTCLDGGATAAQAATRMETDPRATRMLLDALASLGIVSKHEDLYSNSEMASTYLTDTAPENLRPSLLHDAHRWHTWSNLTGRIKGTTPPEQYRVLDTSRHRALLAMLDRKSVERAPKLLQAIGIAGTKRILDIGGGSAAYSIAFVRAGAGIEAEVFELPQVAPVTQEYIARAGLQNRIRTRAGDFLAEELGTGFDLILLFSITHMLGEQENQALLDRCHRALNPGGRIAIHDHILDANKTRPRAGAIFALNMLVATSNGGTYSFEEYLAWLRSAGFSSVERRALEDAPTGILIGTR